MAWLSPFKNMAKHFCESGKWYTFLEDLYNKLSEYDIQKDRQRYNVADLEDWGQSEKPQGISVTSNTFVKFLNKIENYNVAEFENIKNMTTPTTGSQIEELNQVLSLTLKHRSTIRCSEPYIVVKGSFVGLNEIMQNIINNSDTNNSCRNFKTQLASGKYNLLKVFALDKVFIDTDLPFAGKATSVVFIAPKWEVVGYRSIELHGGDGDPHALPKAKDGAHPGNNGIDGAPGKPGRSGESFFGIGATFENGDHLKIVSNGGKGGRGQDGGNGATGIPGRHAETPSSYDPPCEYGYVNGFRCEEIIKKGCAPFCFNILAATVIITDGSTTTKSFKIFGLPGGRGGDGGNGGRGGKGGDPGNIAILELSQPSEIIKLTSKGEEGDPGRAGAGATQGGKSGDDIIVNWSKYVPNLIGWLSGFRESTKWEWKETIKNDGRSPGGIMGMDGVNAAGLQYPIPANGIQRLPNIINEYKIYLRENLSNRFKKHDLLQFLDQLNNSNDIRKLYDILGLIDEFQGLEEQFHKLSEQVGFSSFFSSLLERINEFSRTHKDGPNADENKKVLSYLYTATLGKMYNIEDNTESNLIINIRDYLNLVTENIKTLKDLQTMNNKIEVVNKYKENYKRYMDKKIEEANSFIDKQISPEIENISTEIDDQINSLIEETILLQKQAEKERKELAEKKKELEYALAIKGMFGCFQLIAGMVSFISPVGAIVGTVIGATSTVGENLALRNEQQTLNLPSDVASAIESIGDKFKTLVNQKVVYLEELLENISDEIKKNPEKLSDMAGKISDFKERLKKATDDKMDFKQVRIIEKELKGELERKGEDLKTHSNDEKSVNALRGLRKIKQIAEFGSLLLNLYNKMKEDIEKMDAITEAIEKIEDKMKALRDYEERIYDSIVPMLQDMEDNMKEISDKLANKSEVALDVTKWQVQSTLKDTKLQIQRLTEGFEIKSDLSRSIEKLDDVMTTLINIYDRIQSYQNQQNLANYIADISSVAASSINIKDQKLANAVNHLEFAIRANILLKQYKAAINAFKQWVFPFADHYIEKPMLPSQLELEENLQNLVQHATREIEAIKQKLDLYNTSVKNGDQYLGCEEFSNKYISSQPFFEWKNEGYGNLISSLLSGKEVVLKADVKDSAPHKDAIKFSEIEFIFKVKNETSQSLLSQTLKGFDIMATHLGNSYYRYMEKIYLITSNSVTISYSFEKNDDGMPIRSNEVYNKINSGDLMLSPYTLWEVRLINKTHQYSYRDLESYKKEINLELSGFGSYVDTSAFKPGTYRSFTAHNPSNLPLLVSKSAGINQCRRSKYRLPRTPNETVADGNYMTNSAPTNMLSPINFLCNFLKTYFISNAIISINQLFIREQRHITNYRKLPEKYIKTKKSNPTLASNLGITDAIEVEATFAEDDCKKERNGPIFDAVFHLNSNGYKSCSKSFLSSDQKDRGKNQLIQAPDINCSLLLADLVARTVTGNRYKSSANAFLLSPREIILGKINAGVVQSESDIERNLQHFQSEKEEAKPSSWFNQLSGYATSMLQFLGLTGDDYFGEYIQDVRNLFV
ncbi:hypothetical protein HNY73_007706 [Argiope bruennichi]|nr:hypothetical protein HNY73_007706 [Argiope bruennichi]